MLFARLKRKHEGAFTVDIGRRSDDASRQFAHVLLAACQKTHIRAAESQRDAQCLGVAASHVGTPFARSAHHGKRRRVGIDHQQRLLGVCCLGKSREVLHDAETVYARHQHASHVAGLQQAAGVVDVGLTVGRSDFRKFDAVVFGIGVNHLAHLRQQR